MTTPSSFDFAEELTRRFGCEEGIYRAEPSPGYWSNLNTDENKELMEALENKPAREAIREKFPALEEVIYSLKRQAGLELLDLTGEETCIDYGCMWGALTIPLAQRTRFVLGVDQTMDSLRFLKARARESRCDNVALLNADLKSMPLLSRKADIAVVNGVLEWIPESGTVELKKFYGQRTVRTYQGNPRDHQKSFLQRVHENLTPGGKLYLAIENRYAYEMFLGVPDPHSNLRFTSIAPRKVADWISRIKLGRAYVNWLYSFGDLEQLLKDAGFSAIDSYLCFPDYRFPQKILSTANSLEDFQSALPDKPFLKWKVRRLLENILFRKLKLKGLAPSIIAIART